MPFENFYKKSDKVIPRVWFVFGLLFSLATIFFVFVYFFVKINISENKAIEPPQSPASERLRHVKELCDKLPKPEKFFFIEEDEPKIFVDSTSIVYRYRSNRSPEEIMPSFVIWFNANGWKSITGDAAMFRKGRQTVSVRVLKPFDVVTGYEIECYESDY